MNHPLLAALAISALCSPVFATDAPQGEAGPVVTNYSAVTRQVNSLLRESKKVVRLDHERDSGVTTLRKEANKITFNSSVNENRLTSIIIEPMGKETPETTALAGAFLSALAAVSNLEEGAALAHLVSAEYEKDGRPRSITLRNGVKLLKYNTEDSSPRYVISI